MRFFFHVVVSGLGMDPIEVRGGAGGSVGVCVLRAPSHFRNLGAPSVQDKK